MVRIRTQIPVRTDSRIVTVPILGTDILPGDWSESESESESGNVNKLLRLTSLPPTQWVTDENITQAAAEVVLKFFFFPDRW